MSWFSRCIVVLFACNTLNIFNTMYQTKDNNNIYQNRQREKKTIEHIKRISTYTTHVSKTNRFHQMGKHRLNSWNVRIERTQMNSAFMHHRYLLRPSICSAAQDSTVRCGRVLHYIHTIMEVSKSMHTCLTLSLSLSLSFTAMAIYRFTNLTNYISNNLIGQAKNAQAQLTVCSTQPN